MDVCQNREHRHVHPLMHKLNLPLLPIFGLNLRPKYKIIVLMHEHMCREGMGIHCCES